MACSGFGIAATLEATIRRLRLDPSFSINVSEAQLFFCYGEDATCGDGVQKIGPILTALVNQGVVRDACMPYEPHRCQLECPDPDTGRVLIERFEAIDDEAEKRAWISSRGPLITVFEMWEDFTYYRCGEYRHVIGDFLIEHCVSVVGYNDADRYWICQNSRGHQWGEDGFFRIEYGDSGIDARMWGLVPA